MRNVRGFEPTAPGAAVGTLPDRRGRGTVDDEPGAALLDGPLPSERTGPDRLWAIALGLVAVRILAGLAIDRFVERVVPVGGFPLTAGGHHPGFFGWDAALYQQVWHSGYLAADPSRATFYPGYPMTVRAVTDLTGIGYDTAALAVSWASLFLATWALLRLCQVLVSRTPRWRPAMLLLWAPASIFLVAGFAESLFLALVAGAFLALTTRRPWLAAAFAAAASATRPEGVFVGVGIAVWALQLGGDGQRLHTRVADQRRLLVAALLGVASEVGFLAWSGFLWRRYGSPIAELHAQKYWQRHLTWPLHPVEASLRHLVAGTTHGPGAANIDAVSLLDDLVVGAALVALAGLVLWVRNDRRLTWLLVATAAPLLLIISNGPGGTSPEAADRLVMCLPAMYLVAARIRSEWVWATGLVLSAAVATGCSALFNLGGWFT